MTSIKQLKNYFLERKVNTSATQTTRYQHLKITNISLSPEKDHHNAAAKMRNHMRDLKQEKPLEALFSEHIMNVYEVIKEDGLSTISGLLNETSFCKECKNFTELGIYFHRIFSVYRILY